MKKLKSQAKSSDTIKAKFYLKPEEKDRLFDIKMLLTENPSQHFTIPQLAKRALMNDFKLKKGFRVLFNKSIHDFHFEIRMIKAKELIINTSLSLEEIAQESGYQYVSSFIFAFKKCYRITPASLRRSVRE